MNLQGFASIVIAVISIIFVIWINEVEGQQLKHPRQVPNHANFDDKDAEHRRKFQFLVEFLHTSITSELMRDFNQTCDSVVHTEWALSGTKSLFSGDQTTSFSQSSVWHGKICNFFYYLDCVNNVCICAAPDKFNLAFTADPLDNPRNDKPDPSDSSRQQEEETNVKRIKKRRCRVANGELCGYIWIQPTDGPGPPQQSMAFSGVDIAVPDYFECSKTNKESCQDHVEDPAAFPALTPPITSKRCKPETT